MKHAAFGVFVAPSWPPLLSCITCFLPSIQTAPLPPLEPSRVLPLLKERFKNGGARKSQPVGNCRFYGSREGFSSSIWEFFFFFLYQKGKGETPSSALLGSPPPYKTHMYTNTSAVQRPAAPSIHALERQQASLDAVSWMWEFGFRASVGLRLDGWERHRSPSYLSSSMRKTRRSLVQTGSARTQEASRLFVTDWRRLSSALNQHLILRIELNFPDPSPLPAPEMYRFFK